MTKDWDRAAMRFASAQYLARQGMLDVTFANGDHFLLATESILPGVGPRPTEALLAQPLAATVAQPLAAAGPYPPRPEDSLTLSVLWPVKLLHGGCF